MNVTDNNQESLSDQSAFAVDTKDGPPLPEDASAQDGPTAQGSGAAVSTASSTVPARSGQAATNTPSTVYTPYKEKKHPLRAVGNGIIFLSYLLIEGLKFLFVGLWTVIKFIGELFEWLWEIIMEHKGIAAFIAAVIAVVGLIFGIRAGQNAKYDYKNIVLTLTERVDTPTESSYCTFRVNVRNNGKAKATRVEGLLTIYNHADEVLLDGIWYFSTDMEPDTDNGFTIEVEERHTESFDELYYSDFEDLRATFTVSKITFNHYKDKEYPKAKPTVALERSPSSDGVSSVERKYLEANAHYSAYEYIEALALFEEIEYYKDSADLYAQCYEAALPRLRELAREDAARLAGLGKYDEACNVLEAVGYSSSQWGYGYYENGDYLEILAAYEYALAGDYVSAASLGLTRIALPEDTFRLSYREFYGCEGVTEIVLNEGLSYIEGYAFDGCAALSSIVLPKTLYSLSANALSGYSGRIYYRGTVTEWEAVVKEESWNPNSLTVYCSDGEVTYPEA